MLCHGCVAIRCVCLCKHHKESSFVQSYRSRPLFKHIEPNHSYVEQTCMFLIRWLLKYFISGFAAGDIIYATYQEYIKPLLPIYTWQCGLTLH